MRHLPRCLLVALALSALAPTAGHPQSDPEPLRVRCRWFPPTTGSPPVRYHLQIQDPRTPSSLDTTYVVPHQGGAGQTPQEFQFTDGDYWQHYRARVRAEDALGRLGPWSAWSGVVVFEVADPEP